MITFPSSPSNGDIATVADQTWKYNGTLNAWEKISGALYAITGLVENSATVTVSGDGTLADPYSFNAPDPVVTRTVVTAATDLDETNSSTLAGRVVVYDNTSNVDFEIAEGMPTGMSWVVEQLSTGIVTIVADVGTVYAEGSKFKTAGINTRVYIEHRGSNNFVVIGGAA